MPGIIYEMSDCRGSISKKILPIFNGNFSSYLRDGNCLRPNKLCLTNKSSKMGQPMGKCQSKYD